VYEELKQLGKEIEAARREAGLSATELALGVGVSPGYMRTVERGVNPKTGKPSRPKVEALFGAARTLGRDPGPWLALAGYSETLTDSKRAPVRGSVKYHAQSIGEAAEKLTHRGPFLSQLGQEALQRFATEFRLIAGGTIRCGPDDEPRLTALAMTFCKAHLRAVSYQDENWWPSDKGDRYLDTHEDLLQKDVELTRIFLIDTSGIDPLVPTLERHVALGINTFVIDKQLVDEEQWRDVVIYDRDILRVADATDLENDRKLAEFTDDESRIEAALVEFDELRNRALSIGGEAERVLSGLRKKAKSQ
jgi:transcriptional regulator with XRE-family HTH domain